MRPGRFSTLSLVVLATLALSINSVHAQTTAVGPYYATPAWDQTLPSSTRFIVLSNMDSQAVLDRETGLVWQRTPGTVDVSQPEAFRTCWEATTGGRQGWRLPTVAELMTLGDATNRRPFEIRLTPGHPFLLSTSGDSYWASDRFGDDGDLAISFGHVSDPNFRRVAGGQVMSFAGFNDYAIWCVRGGQS